MEIPVSGSFRPAKCCATVRGRRARYRLNWDVRQGFTDISHFEGTFAYGVKGRAEIFGAVRFITRIDRDTRPIFGFGGDRYGGVDNNYPFVREGWIGNKFGDTFLGAKVNSVCRNRASTRSPSPSAAW